MARSSITFVNIESCLLQFCARNSILFQYLNAHIAVHLKKTTSVSNSAQLVINSIPKPLPNTIN